MIIFIKWIKAVIMIYHYIYFKNIVDTKYFVAFFLILFLSISFFFFDNRDQEETFTISFEMNDDIDLTYSQKINSVILTNQEIIDVTTIRKIVLIK